jgi:hypothetical protein
VTVRSDRLSGPTNISPGIGSVTLFTVPAGQTWIVKRVVVWRIAGALTDQFQWGVSAGGVASIHHSGSLEAEGTDDHETWWALDAAAWVYVFNKSTTVAMRFTTYGAKLLGVA